MRMKRGDRVMVIAKDEYAGMSGVISEVAKDGRLVVDIEAHGTTWPITFAPHDVELEAMVKT